MVRPIKTLSRFAVFLLVLTGFSAAFAQAPQSIQIMVTAGAYEPVDPSVPVSVRVYGESPDSQNLQAQTEKTLREKGFIISTGAAQIIVGVELNEQLSSSVVRGIQPKPEDRGEIRARSTEPQNPDEMLGETARSRPRVGRANPSLVLTMNINDRTNGRRLWEGRATCDSPTERRAAVVSGMIAPLVNRIGQTVRDESTTLILP